MKKLLAEAMPLFRSYQKNVKRLVQLRDPQPHRHHTRLVRTAPSLRADMIFRMDNAHGPRQIVNRTVLPAMPVIGFLSAHRPILTRRVPPRPELNRPC